MLPLHRRRPPPLSPLLAPAEATANILRGVFVLFGILLLFSLWRAYRVMYKTLGADVDELHEQISRLGNGDFLRLDTVEWKLEKNEDTVKDEFDNVARVG
jgi:hypothetical protein